MTRRALLSQYRLPDEYQEVEYIGCNGAQYINTGIKMSQSDSFQIAIQVSSSASGAIAIFGGRTSATSNNYTVDYTVETGKFGLDFGDYTVNRLSIIKTDLTKTVIEVNTEDMKFSVDAANENISQITFAMEYEAYLFYESGNPYDPHYFVGNCYYAIIPNKRHLVPCYRKSDSVTGMYDLISNTFFTNQGAGSFTRGSDVN